jgi:hypothetical protein
MGQWGQSPVIRDIDRKISKGRKITEETDPHEAITLYQQRAKRLMAQRDRKQYHEAWTCLAKMRSVYERPFHTLLFPGHALK